MANENKLVTLEDLGEAYTALYNRDVMTAADKTKLDGVEAGAQVNPGNATTSAAGLMSADDKSKLNGIQAGAQVNTVTGIKGAAEFDYRDGNVSLDAEDVGAVPKSDLTSIIATGTSNTTGAAITTDNPYFYLNGVLVKALTNIASDATFTDGTNYEAVTAGGLNSINRKIANLVEQQDIPVSGFNGNMKETELTITLKQGYKPYLLQVVAPQFDTSHYIHYAHSINSSTGTFYIEHNLNSNVTLIKAFILWIPN